MLFAALQDCSCATDANCLCHKGVNEIHCEPFMKGEARFCSLACANDADETLCMDSIL